jgi:hypothetical protein|tara:strand:- start:213 stop:320 length:108 start_codon:yes stop_codon:yes gene_type:complete
MKEFFNFDNLPDIVPDCEKCACLRVEKLFLEFKYK